jgi:predicted SprT family Zn-dependent metalloprotease
VKKLFPIGKAHFQVFSKEIKQKVADLGLHSWRVMISHVDMKPRERLACVTFWGDSRQADFFLNRKTITRFSPRDMKEVAVHEVAHLMVADLVTVLSRPRPLDREVSWETEKLATALVRSWRARDK